MQGSELLAEQKITTTLPAFLRNYKSFAVADFAENPDTAEKLWKLSEELVWEQFSI